MKVIRNLLLIITVLTFIVSCQLKERAYTNYGAKNKPIQYAFDAFDTQCSISFYGNLDEETAGKFFFDMKTLVNKFEDVFSKTKVGSEIYDINHRVNDSVMICDDTATIFEIAKGLYSWSHNKFDISAGTLIDLWDVQNRKTIPSLIEINEARKHIGNYNYEIEYNVEENEFRRNKITFTGDKLTQYDLGGLIKGYCCDRLKSMLEQNDDIKACIVNLGGNVLCTGEVTGRAGGAFKVGIIKPFTQNDIVDTVEVKNRNVITSGNYQRYFKMEGDDRVYHHIIDPMSGYPTENGLDSVTIISKNGLLGDYLSTACMLMGEKDSEDLIDYVIKELSHKDVQAVFVRSDGSISKYPKKVNLTK